MTEKQRGAGYYFKFNLESELRGDSKSRAEFYKTMQSVGAFSVNTILQKEGIAVLDAGLDYSQVTMPMKDAQFIESMKWNRQQIASIYKVPPHKIGELDRATFSNIEQQSLDYVKT
ncbi:phage portal protein, partial [Bacillus licheniformis]